MYKIYIPKEYKKYRIYLLILNQKKKRMLEEK